MTSASQFARKARELAAQVRAGNMTQEDAEFELGLTSGERLASTGIVVGYAAHPEIPRFGADETDQDYPYGTGAHPDGGQYGPADMALYDQHRSDES